MKPPTAVTVNENSDIINIIFQDTFEYRYIMTYIQIVSDRSHILRNQVMEVECFEVLIVSNFHVAMTMYTMYTIYTLADSGI